MEKWEKCETGSFWLSALCQSVSQSVTSQGLAIISLYHFLRTIKVVVGVLFLFVHKSALLFYVFE